MFKDPQKAREYHKLYKRAHKNVYREYARKRMKKWREDHPKQEKKYARKAHLKRRYGISEDLFQFLVDQQGNKCAICGKPEPTRPVLSVDHNHRTGKVRGLLCSKCNLGLGYFQDNPTTLDKASEYLRTRSDSE